jgi:hypothetical protein
MKVIEEYMQVATRWLEGLIGKDPSITKEVYAIHSVEFDRQVFSELNTAFVSSEFMIQITDNYLTE